MERAATGRLARGWHAGGGAGRIRQSMPKGMGERGREFFRCRVLRPMLRLLRRGVTPKKLAWSLAVALVVGVNPFLGVTTVSMIVLAWVFRLNQVVTQIGIHLMAPVQILLFLVWIKAGRVLFGAERLPMTRHEIVRMSERHPLRLLHALWSWEWHALLVWGVFAAVAVPVLAVQIRRLLVRAMRRHRELLADDFAVR